MGWYVLLGFLAFAIIIWVIGIKMGSPKFQVKHNAAMLSMNYSAWLKNRCPDAFNFSIELCARLCIDEPIYNPTSEEVSDLVTRWNKQLYPRAHVCL